MIKDKIKKVKPITDNTNVLSTNPLDTVQCPYCKSLHSINVLHQCNTNKHGVCSICGKDMITKTGLRWKFKKSFTYCAKIICWDCAFNIHKQFKKENEK